jgi:hypothetical protein
MFFKRVMWQYAKSQMIVSHVGASFGAATGIFVGVGLSTNHDITWKPIVGMSTGLVTGYCVGYYWLPTTVALLFCTTTLPQKNNKSDIHKILKDFERCYI